MNNCVTIIYLVVGLGWLSITATESPESLSTTCLRHGLLVPIGKRGLLKTKTYPIQLEWKAVKALVEDLTTNLPKFKTNLIAENSSVHSAVTINIAGRRVKEVEATSLTYLKECDLLSMIPLRPSSQTYYTAFIKYLNDNNIQSTLLDVEMKHNAIVFPGTNIVVVENGNLAKDALNAKIPHLKKEAAGYVLAATASDATKFKSFCQEPRENLLNKLANNKAIKVLAQQLLQFYPPAETTLKAIKALTSIGSQITSSLPVLKWIPSKSIVKADAVANRFSSADRWDQVTTGQYDEILSMDQFLKNISSIKNPASGIKLARINKEKIRRYLRLASDTFISSNVRFFPKNHTADDKLVGEIQLQVGQPNELCSLNKFLPLVDGGWRAKLSYIIVCGQNSYASDRLTLSSCEDNYCNTIDFDKSIQGQKCADGIISNDIDLPHSCPTKWTNMPIAYRQRCSEDLKSPVVITTPTETTLSFNCNSNFIQSKTVGPGNHFVSTSCAIYTENEELLPANPTRSDDQVPTFPEIEPENDNERIIWGIGGLTISLFVAFTGLILYMVRRYVFFCDYCRNRFSQQRYAVVSRRLPPRRGSFHSLPAQRPMAEEDDIELEEIEIHEQPPRRNRSTTKGSFMSSFRSKP